MNKLLRVFRRTHQQDVDALSAHLDGALDAAAAAALTSHLATCDACTTTLEELRQTKSMLATLPSADAPRSFRLRPADVANTDALRNAPGRETPTWMRAMPALSAAAIIVFGVVVAVDLTSSTSGPSSDRFQAASAPRAPQAAGALAATRTSAETGNIAADKSFASPAPAMGQSRAPTPPMPPAGTTLGAGPTGAPPNGDSTLPQANTYAPAAGPPTDGSPVAQSTLPPDAVVSSDQVSPVSGNGAAASPGSVPPAPPQPSGGEPNTVATPGPEIVVTPRPANDAPAGSSSPTLIAAAPEGALGGTRGAPATTAAQRAANSSKSDGNNFDALRVTEIAAAAVAIAAAAAALGWRVWSRGGRS